MSDNKKIWERLRDHIDKKGIKREYIAKKTKLNPNIISKILNGKRKLDADELELIMDSLDLEPNTIIMINKKSKKN